MNLKNFLKELIKKDVFKKLSIYVVSSWILIQVFAIIWEPLGLPKKSVTILLIILLIGFPINIFLVWKYHLAALEIKKIVLDASGNSIEHRKVKSAFKRMYFSVFIIISAISIIISAIIINNNFISTSEITIKKLDLSTKIAVLKFGNNTGDNKFDIVSKMTADWISHGITENQISQVVSSKNVENYADIIKNSTSNSTIDYEKILKEYFKPKKIISGNFYLKDGNLLFQSSIKDGLLNETLISFKSVECNSDNPLDCIEKLKQLVLGYLITENNQEINLQESPPKYEAYQSVLNAKANFKVDSIYLNYLNLAIKTDSNYFEPKLLKIGHFYNNLNFKKADSLRKAIPITISRNERQRNLLNLYESLLLGKNSKSYSFIKKEYKLAPFDLESNSSAMTIALQYVNKPEDVAEFYNEISMDGLDIENCPVCKYRIYIKSLARIELKKYKEVIKHLEEITTNIDDKFLKRTIATAYVRTGKLKELNNLMAKAELLPSTHQWEELTLFIGKELLLLGDKINASIYFDKIINSDIKTTSLKNYTSALYYKEAFKKAVPLFESLVNEDSTDKETLTKLAITYYKNGELSKSKETIDKLTKLFEDYQYGEIDYYLAQYYAAINSKEESLDHLLKSVAQGFNYTPETFQNDIHFINYKNTDEFKKVLNFWH
jgi:hypothetical protein